MAKNSKTPSKGTTPPQEPPTASDDANVQPEGEQPAADATEAAPAPQDDVVPPEEQEAILCTCGSVDRLDVGLPAEIEGDDDGYWEDTDGVMHSWNGDPCFLTDSADPGMQMPTDDEIREDEALVAASAPVRGNDPRAAERAAWLEKHPGATVIPPTLLPDDYRDGTRITPGMP